MTSHVLSNPLSTSSQSSNMDICVRKTNSSPHEEGYGCARVVFDGYGRCSQYSVLHGSPRFVSGIRRLWYASAGGDRLIVLTTLGVAYEDGASVLVVYDKTFS